MTPSFSMNAATVLTSLSRARMHDLALRAESGALTSLEALALCVLRGGRDGEESAPAFIDAALLEYNHGSYRVPVRVASACSLVVVTVPQDDPNDCGDMSRHIQDGIIANREHGRPDVLVVRAGVTVQAFDLAPGATVDVRRGE